MGEIKYLFPKETIEKEEDLPEKKSEIEYDLDADKILELLGTLGALKKSNPEMFKQEIIDREMEKINSYSDYKLSMRINNINEEAIRSNPCFYAAINYVAWNRKLLKKYKQKKFSEE